MLMRVLDLAGPILCGLGGACMLAGARRRSHVDGGEGADGGRSGAVRPGGVSHPRLRAALLRARAVAASVRRGPVWLGIAACALVAGLAVGSAVSATRPVVVIDPGHDLRGNPVLEPIGPGSTTLKIKDGGGTRGVTTGISEASLNLDVSLRLRRLLERAGVRVVMTRTTTSGTSVGNIARARIANDAHARLFLRVHADGHENPAVRGTHILVPADRVGWTDDVYRPSRRAASLVLSELVAALGFPDRGISEHTDFTGFNWADVPVILVEMGFMTNATEDRSLATARTRAAAARGMCRGTLRFLGRAPACAAKVSQD